MVAPGQSAWSGLLRRARPMRLRALHGRMLVLAPHADDETLGAGALIAALAAAGRAPEVAILTDGSRSHVGAPGWSEARIAGARRIETGHALRALGVTRPALHLGWRDASPHRRDDPAFERTVRWLVTHIRRWRVTEIAVTWGGEGHCDHAAAAELAQAVVTRMRGAVALYEYLVWGWANPALGRRLRERRAISLDVARHRPAQRRALAQHRTQTGTRIAGAVDAFRLPRTMIALCGRPRMILLRQGPSHAP